MFFSLSKKKAKHRAISDILNHFFSCIADVVYFFFYLFQNSAESIGGTDKIIQKYRR